MPTTDSLLNKKYVAKSRQKLINSIGIDEYRRKMALKQKEYRAKKKAIANPHIQDRKLKSVDINELMKVRLELKREKRKK